MSDKNVDIEALEVLKYNQCFNMQHIFDDLYAKSKNNEIFDNLCDIIFSKENVLLAYKNIKSKIWKNTTGTDELTIQDIGKLTIEEVSDRLNRIIFGQTKNYIPRLTKLIEIEKYYDIDQKYSIGIPCIWDKLIQQCIKQVLEPICEAKFSDNSYGHRPFRTAENALAKFYQRVNLSGLHYIIEIGIENFYDNVNYSKLIKQLWTFGIHDKHLIYIIRQILTGNIKMPDGTHIKSEKGLVSSGILQKLFTNIYLNELDKWVDSNWQEHPVVYKFSAIKNDKGTLIKSNAYNAMRKTKLKEMYILRYDDDIRIFCRNQEQADKTLIAVQLYLKDRLRLNAFTEKSKVVNIEIFSTNFLGFRIKVHQKGDKKVVVSHIADNQLKKIKEELTGQIKNVARPRNGRFEFNEIRTYNSMVLQIHNYYKFATHVCNDLAKINWNITIKLNNRMKRSGKISKKGRPLTKMEQSLYGKSAQLWYSTKCNEPIYPIGYIQHKNPMNMRKDKSSIIKLKNIKLAYSMYKDPCTEQNIEYLNNRIYLFVKQEGKCAITDYVFTSSDEIHCHHKVPKKLSGTDDIDNLIIVSDIVHKLIHAKDKDTIDKYLDILKLSKVQLDKVNELRLLAKNKVISFS